MAAYCIYTEHILYLGAMISINDPREELRREAEDFVLVSEHLHQIDQRLGGIGRVRHCYR